MTVSFFGDSFFLSAASFSPSLRFARGVIPLYGSVLDHPCMFPSSVHGVHTHAPGIPGSRYNRPQCLHLREEVTVLNSPLREIRTVHYLCWK